MGGFVLCNNRLDRRMKKLSVICCLCWMMVMPLKANDPLLIRMDGREVRLSEFVWYFNRAGRSDDVYQYFRRFLDFQLKVADARRLRLDTLSDFRSQSEFLKAKVLETYFMDCQLTDSYRRQLTELLTSHYSEKEWVKIDVFTYRLSQHASAQEESNAVRVMNSWMKHLDKVGVPNETDLAWAHENGVIKPFDANVWTPANRLLKEILKIQANLPVGSWSKPFESPLGFHIVRVLERKSNIGPDNFPEVDQYLKQQGISSPAFKHSQYEAWMKGECQLPIDVQRALTQAYDGLLAMYWDQYEQSPGDENEEEINPRLLKEFFEEHEKNYRWEFPHFKGAVLHCLNKKAASKIKKKLKKLPISRWKETFNKLQQETPEDYRGVLECGLFQIGKNPYVDRLAFKCGTYQPHPKYPYTILIGKKLKKGPEEYTDVLSKVTKDFMRQRANDRFSQLFARFNVEINEDVLKTVNSCGNK